MQLIHRHKIHQKILDHIKNPQKILVIEGVRQTGKTTAIQMALKEKPHVLVTLTDEDLPTDAIRNSMTLPELEKNLNRHFDFLPDGSKILVIDEAQKSENLYTLLLQIHREWSKVPLILSGSVMGAFFHRSDQKKIISPAGRIEKIICRPFSFFEYLEFTDEINLKKNLEEIEKPDQLSDLAHQQALRLYFDYLMTGGHPEAIRLGHNTKELFNYFKTLLGFFAQDADRYLNEVTGEQQKQFSTLFRTTIDAIARLTASPTTRSSLISTDSPAYRKDLPALLNALEEWHFIFRLPTKMKTMTTKQGTNSKKYIWDVGVLNHLLNLSRNVDQNNKELLSRLIESVVCQELIFYLETKERLFSWKSNQKQNNELDFLAHLPEEDFGIEVKATANPSKKALSQLAEFLKFNPQAKGCVVYLGNFYEEKCGNRNIPFIPPYLLGSKAFLENQEK